MGGERGAKERSVSVHLSNKELTVANVATALEPYGSIVQIAVKKVAQSAISGGTSPPKGRGVLEQHTRASHAVVEFETKAQAEACVFEAQQRLDITVRLVARMAGLTIKVPSAKGVGPSPSASPHSARRGGSISPPGLSPRGGRSRGSTPTAQQIAMKDEEMAKWEEEHAKEEHSKLVGETLTGKVATAKGSFGFITPNFTDKLNLFFHSSNVKQTPTERKLRSDDEVSFKLTRNGSTGKLNAIDIVCIKEAPRLESSPRPLGTPRTFDNPRGTTTFDSPAASRREWRPPNLKIPEYSEVNVLANQGLRSAPSAYASTNPWGTPSVKIPQPFSARGTTGGFGSSSSRFDGRASSSDSWEATSPTSAFIPPFPKTDGLYDDTWSGAGGAFQSLSLSPPRAMSPPLGGTLGAIGDFPLSPRQIRKKMAEEEGVEFKEGMDPELADIDHHPTEPIFPGGFGFNEDYQRSRAPMST